MLLRDLLNLPDQVRKGDFVLKLSDGVTAHARETVADYVATPQLVKCFDEALGLIRSALDGKTSKAAYLHGSFGSGKSHFMAILLLLLQQDAHARGIVELSGVVEKHNAWTQGKRFLLVPYHMIGARDMESAILGGYAEHVRKVHPGCVTPAVYRSAALLADANRLREKFGDAQFFASLNSGKAAQGGTEGWGEITEHWDAASFEKAAKVPDSPEHRRLVGDLVDAFFNNVRTNSEEFIDLDEGLAVISEHAHNLGYDGLILFLDELILWLASHAAEIAFLNREGSKLAKLVEAQNANRPAPIVSFVARQRDLSELVGQHIAGNLKLGFTDILRHWEGRFTTIRLEDRNLPAIAEKRVLKPKDAGAKAAMDAEFSRTDSIRESVRKVLLTDHAKRDDFRKLYPFTPALVDALVAVSSLLQRERTALKIMLDLLVKQKHTLKLGELVPVGDLFDAIEEGDEAFNDVMKDRFKSARNLWNQRFRPLLEQEHGVTREELESLPWEAPKATAFRNDGRLLKTLLLAALAPEVESLRNMTAARLAALNHGTITSPIKGGEVQAVLARLRRWAGQVGQLRISDEGTEATVQIQLSDVDTDTILAQAESIDSYGERARKIKELVFAQMKIGEQDGLWVRHPFTWRATKRWCNVLFTNVREAVDETLRTDEDEWKLIVDYPFDTEGNTPGHDLERIRRYTSTNPPTRTVVWVPSFFGLSAQRDLSNFVKLEHILTGDRFGGFVSHLAATDQQAARAQLENQRSQLKARLIGHLEAAYGLANGEPGALDTAHEVEATEHQMSLDPSLDLRAPTGANLHDAFSKLLERLMLHQFPNHPPFEENAGLGLANLKRIMAEIEKAARTEDGRIAVDQPMRPPMNQVAVPLKLGAMGATHFQVGQHWRTQFEKQSAATGGALTAGKLRQWMDEPQAMGLPTELQNLIILSFAAQTNRSFYLHGTPVAPGLEKLENELELREEKLPSEDAWKVAIERGGAIFGITTSALLNAANLAQFTSKLRETAERLLPEVQNSLKWLERVPNAFSGTDPKLLRRYGTAQEGLALLRLIGSSEGASLVQKISTQPLAATPAALGSGLAKAHEVATALEGASWEILDGIRSAQGAHAETAQAILDTLKQALAADEYVTALKPVLQAAQKNAVTLITAMVQTPAIPPAAPIPFSPSPVQPEVPAARGAQDPEHPTPTVSNPSYALTFPFAWKALLEQNPKVEIDLSRNLLRHTASGEDVAIRFEDV